MLLISILEELRYIVHSEIVCTIESYRAFSQSEVLRVCAVNSSALLLGLCDTTKHAQFGILVNQYLAITKH